MVTVDSAGFITHWCPLCEGVSHPATGCVYSSTFVVCKACTIKACIWIQAWTASKGRKKGLSFYDSIGIHSAGEK